MGLMRFVVAICLFGLLTLEGLNTKTALEGQKNATALVLQLGSQFKVDAKILKQITDNLPYLKFVALSAFGALLIRFHAFFLALYVILTRAEHLLKVWGPVQKAITTKGPVEGAVSVTDELTYIFLTVSLVAWLLDYSFSFFGSKRVASSGKAERGSKNVAK